VPAGAADAEATAAAGAGGDAAQPGA